MNGQADCREPMLLSPAFKDYIWGGDRLIREFGKKTELRPVAESWELSCHPDGLSAIASGIYKGRTLADVLDEHPGWIITGNENASAGFPVLIKFIDARLDLSLQVHPGDDYAKKHENDNGKNEAWYVIDCDPGTSLILGLKNNLPEGGVPGLLKDGAILNYVNNVPVKPGDCFIVPAGLLHAIRGGALIAEVQQSSNVTYRVYDYGRTGPDGKPRKLHTERAAAVIDASARVSNAADTAMTTPRDGYRITDLIGWQFFRLSRVDVSGAARLRGGNAFQALLVIAGELTVEYGVPAGNGNGGSVSIPNDNNAGISQHIAGDASHISVSAGKGACVFIPAGFGEYYLRGCGQALLTTI